MNRVSDIIRQAEERCRASGARLTDKRKRVLACLLKSEKALSAYDLTGYWQQEFDETIPPMSVYRILAFLEAENLVHKLHLANKYVACSHIGCDHEHEVPQSLICDRCSSVKEIGIGRDLVNALEKNVQTAGYLLRSPQLELHCLCRGCASATS